MELQKSFIRNSSEKKTELLKLRTTSLDFKKVIILLILERINLPYQPTDFQVKRRQVHSKKCDERTELFEIILTQVGGE